MTQNITHDDLLLFIYKECSPAKGTAIKRAILANAELAAEYHAMLSIQDELNREFLDPSQTSVNIILQHAMQEVEH